MRLMLLLSFVLEVIVVLVSFVLIVEWRHIFIDINQFIWARRRLFL